MDSKLANIIDKRIDVMYEMADKLIATGLSEEQADTAAEMILNSRADFMELLKSVKDIPTPKVVASEQKKPKTTKQAVKSDQAAQG